MMGKTLLKRSWPPHFCRSSHTRTTRTPHHDCTMPRKPGPSRQHFSKHPYEKPDGTATFKWKCDHCDFYLFGTQFTAARARAHLAADKKLANALCSYMCDAEDDAAATRQLFFRKLIHEVREKKEKATKGRAAQKHRMDLDTADAALDAVEARRKKVKRQLSYHEATRMGEDGAVDDALGKFIVANDLAPNILDNHFTKAAFAALRHAKTPYVPLSRGKFKNVILPRLKQRQQKATERHLEGRPNAGRTVTGDGATKKKTPLIDILVHVPKGGVQLLEVVDCTQHLAEGGVKDRFFIAENLCRNIERVGPKNVFLVVCDGGGDWSQTEDLIQSKWPWISFLHCVSHEVSLIIKDCFLNIDALVRLENFVIDAQHWFSTHAVRAMLVDHAHANEPTTFTWPAPTRYCGKLLQIRRFFKMKELLRRVCNSGVYLDKNFKPAQPADDFDPIKTKILGDEIWPVMEAVTESLGPLLLLCRLADGQKGVLSKLHITQKYVRAQMTALAAAKGEGSVAADVLVYLESRWAEMQSDVAKAAYVLDPQFVLTSKTDVECTLELWKIAKEIERPEAPEAAEAAGAAEAAEAAEEAEAAEAEWEAEWASKLAVLAQQLAQFRLRTDSDLPLMRQAAAWCAESLSMTPTLDWWQTWGVEMPELQRLAYALVPLICGSGPAERTWGDIGRVATKQRGPLDMTTVIDIVMVRHWLRREFNVLTIAEREALKAWEVELVGRAGLGDEVAEQLGGDGGGGDGGGGPFLDSIEPWEEKAATGRELTPQVNAAGVEELVLKKVLALTAVKKDNVSFFKLRQKYKGMRLVDKNPDGDAGDDDLEDEDEWEHRAIIGIMWKKRKGWCVETRLIGGREQSEPYYINSALHDMIRASPHNMRQMQSVVDAAPEVAVEGRGDAPPPP